MTRERGLRLRSLVDSYFYGFLLGVLILGLLGGFLAVSAHADPPTETVTDETSSWVSTGEFGHQATVIHGTRPFPNGTVLRNRSVYFRSISPRLNGSFTYGYTASEGGSLSTNTSLQLVVRSYSEDPRGNATEYWRYETDLAQTTRSLAPREDVTVSFSRNLSSLNREIQRIEERIGGSPGTIQVTVLATVRLDGERNGAQVDQRRTYQLPIVLEGGLIRVDDPGRISHSGNQVAKRTITLSPGAGWSLGGPLLLVIGFVGLGGLGVGRYYDWYAVTEEERVYLEYRQDRSEFDEWITEADIPSHRLASAETNIDTSSLSGLVDLAIDTDRRVLESASADRYVVLDGDVVYRYDPPGPDRLDAVVGSEALATGATGSVGDILGRTKADDKPAGESLLEEDGQVTDTRDDDSDGASESTAEEV